MAGAVCLSDLQIIPVGDRGRGQGGTRRRIFLGPAASDKPEFVYRTAAPPAVGESFENELFTVEIVAADGRGPRELRLTFKVDMDASHLIFLADRAGRLVEIEPPEIGESIVIEEAQPQSILSI